MTMHVRTRAMLSAARAIPLGIERKDDTGSMLEMKSSFDKFMEGFETFKTKNDERLKEIEKKGASDVLTTEQLDRLSKAMDEFKADVNKEVAKLNRPALDKKGKEISPELKSYNEKFETYFRKGEERNHGLAGELADLEKKALNAASDPDGGFTVRPEMETAIDAIVKQYSPIRDIASVRTIGTNSYKKLMSMHGTASGWVGEFDGRPQTQGPQLKELDFPAMELYAMPAATQTVLDDSFVNIDQWLADEVALEFAFQEGSAFVNGNGVKKPFGFLGYATVANASYGWGKVGYLPSGASGAFVAAPNGADCFIDLYHGLKTAYRKNGTFAMNNTTLAATRKLKDSNGAYLVNAKLTVQTDAGGGLVEQIMGKPVLEIPDMPDPAANSLSVAFADFKRAYLIVDRVGIRTLRDPYTAKPYVLFYTTKRVGGGIQNFEAIKLMKFAVS